MNASQFKVASAAIGAGALIAMGSFALASSGTSFADPMSPPEFRTTQTTPPDVVATPPITTAPYTIPTGEPQ
jgi:hypothetical protein